MRYHGFIAAGLLAGLLLVGASGCGQKKITECNNLIQVINTGVQSLEKGGKASDDGGAGDLKTMADSMEKVASDAAKVELTIPELKKFSTDYQGMAKDLAKSAREMAAATQAKDYAKMNAAQTTMEKVVALEDPLVESINKFCQGP